MRYAETAVSERRGGRRLKNRTQDGAEWDLMRTFAPGDRVHVARIGTGVVREVRNGGRYVIEIKGRTMVVAGDQIEDAPEGRPPKRDDSGTTRMDVVSATAPRGSTAPSLDLHGKTIRESLDALDTFLNDAILESHAEARVIHGRSGGRVKAAVHERLGQVPAVRSYRVDPRNPGVTIVTF